MSLIEHAGPWYLMVGLDGKAHRVVEKGAVVAGMYDVVEVVPSATIQGAVSALTDVRAYAEALKRSPERRAQRIGADLMGLLASHEWGQ